MTRSRLADGLTVVSMAVAFSVGMGLIAVDPIATAPIRIDIRIRYSQYIPATVRVPHGRTITFVLHNDDPIAHEWMVGDEQMHARHRTGTEPYHARRPTEVSIPPLATIETTVTFDDPLAWRYVCHLPGHEAYGMVGTVNAR